MSRWTRVIVGWGLLAACSEDDLTQGPDVTDPGDTDTAPEVEDTGRPDQDTGDVDTGPPEEECNGVDDDGDGEIDEGFDTNGNGIADCLEEEAYCTPFDTFEDWSYAGSGDWRIEDGYLREGRGGYYDAIAWLYDLGMSSHFAIEVKVGWTGTLNDQVGIAWAVDGTKAFVVRWDDPQGDYSRYSPTGAIDLSYCVAGECSVLAVASDADLYRPSDRTFSTLHVDVNGEVVTVTVDGPKVLETSQSVVRGTGPGVVGLYSNDNDGGAWFDDFCVWQQTE